MKTEKFRVLCEEVLVPMIVSAMERQLSDIHDMLDISASELMRIGERLDDLDAGRIDEADE